ncbi:MAG: rhodanese-like domain-containing protein [Mogibacterium sp.]|nr:rhodanese-like domain-containing protein [Mogibacterium sp.]
MGYYDELPELDINELLEETSLIKNKVLVDVRTPEEYLEGHIPGAINIEAKLCKRSNRSGIESILTDKTAHVYMYCFSGARSGMAAAFLRQMGYDRAENIGGYKDYTGPVSITSCATGCVNGDGSF